MSYSKDGKLEYKEYRKHGVLHNLFGTAWYNEDSKIKESYYIDGKEMTKEDWEIKRNRILMLEEININN